ncbi:MAG TPA: PilZ domain-containing protein [Haliangiales bacterium]|nr:PilZ domain-containing protein [Haliangiales bacterium]
MAKARRRLVPRDDRVTINHEFASVDEFLAEYVSNISRSGAFLRAKKPLPVGTKVNLRFTLIMDELETIEGIGEVVRVQEEPRGMGVVFVTLTRRSQDLIDRLIAGRRDGAPPVKRRGQTAPPPLPADAIMKPKAPAKKP